MDSFECSGWRGVLGCTIDVFPLATRTSMYSTHIGVFPLATRTSMYSTYIGVFPLATRTSMYSTHIVMLHNMLCVVWCLLCICLTTKTSFLPSQHYPISSAIDIITSLSSPCLDATSHQRLLPCGVSCSLQGWDNAGKL